MNGVTSLGEGISDGEADDSTSDDEDLFHGLMPNWNGSRGSRMKVDSPVTWADPVMTGVTF